jgi:hypothetical protein
LDRAIGDGENEAASRGWDVAIVPFIEPRQGHLLFISPVRRAGADTSMAVLGIAVDPRVIAKKILRPLLERIARDSVHRAVQFGVRVHDAGGRVLFRNRGAGRERDISANWSR